MPDSTVQDADRAVVRIRAARGVAFLVLRYLGVRLLGVVASVFLSRMLSPEAFGIYAITLFVLILFSFVSDFGLGASLIQQRRAVADMDLRTVFTVQQLFVGVLLIGMVLAAPGIASAYHLGAGGVWYLLWMAVGGLFASLRTVPTIVLERQLLYGQLSLIELAEMTLFQVLAVALAFLQFGVWSFIAAVVIAKFCGMLLAFQLAHWRPSFGLDLSRFLNLWRFSILFQLSWLTYLLRDYLIPSLGGLILGTVAVGYLNWALALAAVPGQLAQIVGRVGFPSFARYQDSPDLLKGAVEQAVRWLFLVAVPVQLVLVSLAPWLIHLIFSDKWMPALGAFYLLSVHWAGANLTSPLVAALNATGRARLALVLSGAWTAATIALALLFVQPFGFVGIALAYAVTMIGAASAAVISVSRFIPIRLWPHVRLPVAASVVTCGACFVVRSVLPATLLTLLLLGAATALTYVALVWLAEGRRVRTDVQSLLARPSLVR